MIFKSPRCRRLCPCLRRWDSQSLLYVPSSLSLPTPTMVLTQRKLPHSILLQSVWNPASLPPTTYTDPSFPLLSSSLRKKKKCALRASGGLLLITAVMSSRPQLPTVQNRPDVQPVQRCNHRLLLCPRQTHLTTASVIPRFETLSGDGHYTLFNILEPALPNFLLNILENPRPLCPFLPPAASSTSFL